MIALRDATSSPQVEYITVARVAKTQSRHGEVAAHILTEFPEKFSERRQLWLLFATGERREYSLESHWLHQGRVVLKFAGIDSMTEAERLIGADVQIPLSARVDLPSEGVEAAFYVGDLIGCEIFDRGRAIGKITDVQSAGGAAPLLVVHGNDESEHLIPFAQDYIMKITTAAKRIDMDLPEGMLDIDAPVSRKRPPGLPRP